MSITPTPDAAALLAALGSSYFWQVNGGSTWFRSGEAAALPSDHDVYFGVNPASPGQHKNPRGTRGKVQAITCLYAEFDAKDFNGDKTAVLAHIRALPLAPSQVNDSGGGYHCYWLLDQPHLLDTPEAHEHARRIQARWVDFVGGDKAAKDLVRVLRVPGTLNTKYDPPRPVYVVNSDLGRRYSMATIETLLPAPIPTPAPQPIAPAAVPAAAGETVRDLIAAFNAQHPVDQLLASYGAQRTRDGWACACGVVHEHATQIATTSQGNAIFFSHRCRWAPTRTDRNGRPIADSFDLFTQVEHGGDKSSALRALRLQQRAAQRKRDGRAAAAAATLQAVRDRAAEDLELARCDREVLQAMLQVAGGRAWCRPSKARLVEMTGYSLGSVKRALMRLEVRGYFRSEGDGGRSDDTAIRTFLRGSSTVDTAPPAEEDAPHPADDPTWIKMIHVYIKTSEGGGQVGDDDAPSPDLWAWAPDDADGQGLAALGDLWGDAPAPAPAFDLQAWLRKNRELDGRPAAAPARAPEAVSFAGGASFDPDDLVVEAFDLAAHWRRILPATPAAPEADLEIAQILELVERDQHLVKGPPRDAAAARRYYGLLGRANKAASARQRAFLRAQAAALEEWHPAAEQATHHAPAALRPIGTTGERARPSPAPAVVQADLFAPAAHPSTFTAEEMGRYLVLLRRMGDPELTEDEAAELRRLADIADRTRAMQRDARTSVYWRAA